MIIYLRREFGFPLREIDSPIFTHAPIVSTFIIYHRQDI